MNSYIKMSSRTSTRYFDLDYNKGTEWYRNQMHESGPNDVTMDYSAWYYNSTIVPPRIKKLNPNMKLIMIVRNPVERAISFQTHMTAKKAATAGPDVFRESILHPNGTVNAESVCVHDGMYYLHLRRWLNYFPMQNFPNISSRISSSLGTTS